MKYTIVLFAFLLAFAGRAHADALNKKQIAADAKWLVHIDLDKLRQTQVGEFVVREFVAPHVAQIGSQFKLNATNILQRISSLTAYGADFKQGPDSTGVLLINSDTDTQKALVGLLAAQILANTNGPIKQLDDPDHTVYSFGDQVFIAPQKDGPLVLSKSQARIDATRELLAGKGANLSSTKTFAEYPQVAGGFLYVAVADASTVGNALPAQAKVLQMAEGGRIVLGEKDDQMVLNLSLRGKSAQVARQIQQVVEGMLALVSLGQPENVELTELAKSIKVASADQLITVSLAYPTTKLIDRLNEQMQGQSQKEEHKKVKAKAKNKVKHKQAPAEDEEEEESPETK